MKQKLYFLNQEIHRLWLFLFIFFFLSSFLANAQVLNVTVKNVTCNGLNNGTATASVTGETGGTFAWISGTGIGPIIGAGATISNLSPGDYNCRWISSFSGNAIYKSFTITQPATLAATFTKTDIKCNGGTGAVTVVPSGGTSPYTYKWTYFAPNSTTPVPKGTTATISGLTAGNYYCDITDANGCVYYVPVIVFTEPAILIASTSQTNVACTGGNSGSATVSPSGGTAPYTYSWSGGGTAATKSNLLAGTHTCTIKDANNCSITKSFTITQPASSLALTTNKTNVLCRGAATGTATATVTTGTGTAPYTYLWSPSGGTAATATGLVAGTYTCTVTDANGCIKSSSTTITQPSAAIAVTAKTQTNIACNGGANGAASINTPTGGTGGYTYNWTPGNPTGDGTTLVTGLTAGTWTCTVTDAAGCTASQNFTITQPTALALTSSSQTNVACNGGSNGAASVNVATGGAGGYTYNWTPGNPTGDGTRSVTGLTAGTYTCTVTDANSCIAAINFTITQPTLLNATISQTNVSCNGGSNGTATVTPSGGAGSYTYLWSPIGGTRATASGLSSGSYTCTITDENSCQITREVTVTQPNSPLNATTSKTDVSCNGGSNGTATVSATGGTPGYTYSWSPSGGSSATATGLNAGTYICTITDANSCQITRSVTVTQPVPLSTPTVSTPRVYNQGDTASPLTATSGSTGLLWYTTATGGTGSTTAPTPFTTTGGNTSYWVSSTSANGCESARTEIVVTVNAPANHLHFDGVNDNVMIPDNSGLDFTTAYTIEAMVKLDRTTGYHQTLVSKFDDDNDQRSWMINFGEHGGGTLAVVMTSEGTWTNPLSWDTGFLPTVGTWYHVAVVFDSSLPSNQVKLYVDGVLYAQTTWDFTLTPTDANIYVGGYDGVFNGLNSGADSRFLQGNIDELRMWNVARSQTDIQNLKDCEAQPQPELVAHYKFNQGYDSVSNTSTTTLIDSAGGNNGTLTNFGLSSATSNWKSGSPVTTGNTCTSLSTVVFNANSNFKIYPNPTQNEINIELNSVSNARLEVFDINGRLLQKQSLNTSQSKLDISQFPSGMYLFKVTSNEGTATQKIVKQ